MKLTQKNGLLGMIAKENKKMEKFGFAETAYLDEWVSPSQLAFVYEKRVHEGGAGEKRYYVVSTPLSWLPMFETNNKEQAKKVADAIEVLAMFAIENNGEAKN